MLAAGSDALFTISNLDRTVRLCATYLLGIHSSCEFCHVILARDGSLEYGFELVHASVCEQEGRVVMRDNRRRLHYEVRTSAKYSLSCEKHRRKEDRPLRIAIELCANHNGMRRAVKHPGDRCSYPATYLMCVHFLEMREVGVSHFDCAPNYGRSFISHLSYCSKVFGS